MGLTENINLSSLCKLYRGEKENPYNHSEKTGDEWALEYLKFQIWDAEMSVSTKYQEWLEQWKRSGFVSGLNDEETMEEVYKYAIRIKLQKIDREDIDFQSMYKSLPTVGASEDLDSFTWYKGEKENPYTGDPERPLAAALWIYERDFYLSYLDNADSSTTLEDAYKEWKENFINDYLPGKSPNPYGDRTNWAVVFQTGKR